MSGGTKCHRVLGAKCWGAGVDWERHNGDRPGTDSRRRDCHFADALSPSLLKQPLKVEGDAAE